MLFKKSNIKINKIKFKMSKNEDEEKIIFKIITLGETGVGKTSIIRRYIYNQYNNDCLSTIGLYIFFKDIILKNKEKVQLKIIDAGDQDKFRPYSKSHFKNADGVFFVYAINDKESFNKIKGWITSFNESNNGVKVIKYLLESKNDLDRVVDEEKSKEFAKNNNLKWFSTSSKNNNSINEIFENITESIYQNYIKKGKRRQKNLQLKDKKTKRKNCCLLED